MEYLLVSIYLSGEQNRVFAVIIKRVELPAGLLSHTFKLVNFHSMILDRIGFAL